MGKCTTSNGAHFEQSISHHSPEFNVFFAKNPHFILAHLVTFLKEFEQKVFALTLK